MKLFLKLFLVLVISVVSLSALEQRKILSPDEAFVVNAKMEQKSVNVDIKLGQDIYIYSNKLKFEILKPLQVSLDKEITKPKPMKHEEFLVYEKEVKIAIPLSVIKTHVKSGKFTLRVNYQGCSAQGVCYQPLSKDFDFDLGAASAAKTTPVAQQDVAKPEAAASQNISEENQIADSFTNKSIGLVLLTFFGFGLLLSLTPCVFPMIPILSSVIVSQSSSSMNTKKAFFLSLVYVLAMSLAYTIAGVLAGLFGANIQAALQNPWVISIFSLIFVLLSFSMFGFYELQMPSFIQSRLSKNSENSNKGGIVGVAIMGFLSALIVGPCVAAPLAGALVYIGQSGDALLGGLALFFMSLGMGVPLLIVGAGAGKFMPRPGMWMDAVKSIFGVLMLGVAIWMLARIVSPMTTMLLWMTLFLISSIYMGALEPLKENASGWRKFFKGLGVILFVYSIMLFVGAMKGSTNPLQPLQESGVVLQQAQGVQSTEPVFKKVKTMSELNAVIKTSKKPVFIDFYADWCVSCKEFKEYTFSDSNVQKRMAKFTLVQVDVTKNSADDKQILKRFNIFGPPAIVFFNNNQELKSYKVVGFKKAKEFADHLDKVLGE
ncbi:protein-disulfide reductase DsbD [Sulfurospirillum sp. 1612]|uniref:protein-disulfide reductase DsbD n=1 Tax=Sulfurospirillum sp. 1612 TaxID=3094835 RepID=UPI002F9574C3